MKIRHISQVDYTGCGLACIAMIVNRSYQDVKRIAFRKGILRDENNLGTNYSDLKKLIKYFNLELKHQRKFKKWKDIPVTSIVSTNFGEFDWHWVVYIKGQKTSFIYDPGRKARKIKEFRGRDVGYYLEVKT